MNTVTLSGVNVAGVVKDVSFSIAPGERVGLIGESGSGKTLTALSIMQLINSTGDITLGDVNLATASEKQLCRIRGKRIAMVFQEPMTALDPLMTAGKQIVEAIRIHAKVSRAAAKKQAFQLLAKVELPEDVAARYPHELSGGQRQRVIIAMALAHSPELLICDEPTTALDVTSQKAIVELILKLVREENMGLLFITHDLGLVARTCERVMVMKQGRIVESGSIMDVLSSPEHEYTASLIEAARLPEPQPSTRSDEIAVRVTNVHKQFKKVVAVDDVTLTVHKGQRLGIVGGSGSGKTTVLKMIAGLEHPTSGEITANGRMQMVFQDPMGSLNPRMTIEDIIAEALPSGLPESEASQRIDEVLTDVGLEPSMRHRLPHEFSGGQRQRISIARALAPRPEILLADEPVSALDVSVRKKVLALLDRLVAENNLTLLFVSHDIAVVRSVCTDVVVMNQGRIVESGPVATVLSTPENDYTKTLVDAVPTLDQAIAAGQQHLNTGEGR
ncbi:ATP-binding cassette domain-containing protein [Corynebacterium sp. ZY180755]